MEYGYIFGCIVYIDIPYDPLLLCFVLKVIHMCTKFPSSSYQCKFFD